MCNVYIDARLYLPQHLTVGHTVVHKCTHYTNEHVVGAGFDSTLPCTMEYTHICRVFTNA